MKEREPIGERERMREKKVAAGLRVGGLFRANREKKEYMR